MNFPGRDLLLSTRLGYRAYTALKWGAQERALPGVRPMNTVLKSREDVERAVAEAQRLRLPPLGDPPKTWDTLGALYEVLSRTRQDAAVLDAGAELYSRILPWLYLYGYRRLHGTNLVFDRAKPIRHGPIVYEHGDITATRFPDAHFDAVTCLSVIEHGVDLEAYFKEMARILKPGALLVTSTDYFDEPTDTKGLHAYGVPIRVFSSADLPGIFATAARHGLTLTGPVDQDAQERAVTWREYGLSYSFIVVAMTRR